MDLSKWTKFKSSVLGTNALLELVSGKNITVSRISSEAGLVVDEHAHKQEQVVIVLQGKLSIGFKTRTKILGPGDAYVIAPNESHSAKILEGPFQSLDIFSPIRQDFIDQVDLRKQ